MALLNCEKISSEALEERGLIGQTHRYYTISHKMKPIEAIHIGDYLHAFSRQASPPELAEAIGLPISPALQTDPVKRKSFDAKRHSTPIAALAQPKKAPNF